MKFIVSSDDKTIVLLEKFSLKEIEQLKIWLGADWENWTIDVKERIVEKDNWQPFPINPFPFTPFPNPIFPDPYPNQITPYPNPIQPFYTISKDDKMIMVECKSVRDLASYDAVLYEASNFIGEKVSQQ